MNRSQTLGHVVALGLNGTSATQLDFFVVYTRSCVILLVILD
jgi:hypothetical protein